MGRPPGTAAMEPLPPGRIRVSSGMIAVNKVSGKWPNFCEIGREQRVSGGVVLHVVIDKTGAVSEATVVSGPQILRQAAIDAVRTFLYKPYLLNGDPVEVDTTLTHWEQCSG